MMKNIRATSLIALTLLLVAWLTLLLVACGPSAEEKNAMNLETGVVKIEIENHRFDIPLRYMYGQSVETYGRWPTPKKNRVQVGALTLSVLLPDMRPYYKEDDARWKTQGHGERVEVNIAKDVDGWSEWYPSLLKRTERYAAEGQFYKREPDSYGLIHFSERTGDRYFAQDGQKITITCNTSDPPPEWNGFYSPGCRIKSNYRPGLVLEYYHALQYLPQWKQINSDLKAMFDKFAQAAQTSSTK